MEAARRVRPAAVPTEPIALADDLQMAWSQVARASGLTPRELAAAVALTNGLDAVDPKQIDFSQASLLPERMCRQQGLVPVSHDEATLVIAVSDPRLPLEQLQALRFSAQRSIRLAVMAPDDIDTAQLRLFSQEHRSKSVGDLPEVDLLADDGVRNVPQAVSLAKAIFRAALDLNASDVHAHPFVGGGAIRLRVDGVMRRVSTINASTLEALARYLKAQAGLDPNPLKPQDGRLRLRYGRRMIDVRLSILPAYDGDRIVCRLLDQSRNFSLQSSGFSTAEQQTLQRLVLRDAGMVLLTGPTGSGKTSTLYALLSELNTVDVNIMTIEDPVEYVLPGISQIQANEKQGRSFADTLRSILRQDPDIVLVGEIRDGETARVAAQAALTGHLVLSTLHTNDAMGTIPRLLNLDLDPAILADALLGVVSQRLVRKLCEACRVAPSVPYRPGEEEFHRLTGSYPRYRAQGCKRCAMTGFRGRLPIVEIFETTRELRHAIQTGEHSLRALTAAVGGRHHLMSRSAEARIRAGETTPAEAQRAMGMGFWYELAESHGVDTGTLRDELAEEVLAGRRLRVLVVSTDPLLADEVRSAVPYQLDCADSVAAASEALDQQLGVMAVVIDAHLIEAAGGHALRESLETMANASPWAGLPLLLVRATAAPDDEQLLPERIRVLTAQESTAEPMRQALLQLMGHHV
jgi:type II secretory ATPase GspE/PulE/Tfp pilus assembly ATPase PilB-like protein